MKIVPLRFKGSIAAYLAVILATVQAPAHNLDTTKTSISFALDYFEQMSQRTAAQQPLIQQNDEFWVLLKTTPGPGTKTGVGGYQTFYVPEGVIITDAAYVFPDPSDPRGFRNIPMKSQSPIGSGSVGAASTPQLIGWELLGENHSGDAVGEYYGDCIKAGSVTGMGNGGRA